MTAIGTKQTFQSQPCPLVGLTGHQVLGPPCLLLLTQSGHTERRSKYLPPVALCFIAAGVDPPGYHALAALISAVSENRP